MKNILTIDLEDWHQLGHRRISGRLPLPSDNVLRQLDTLLDLLRQYNVTGTFFVLGTLAQQYPNLVRMIAAEGHEIASHGYAHLTLDRLSREGFEEDTKRAKCLIEDILGMRIYGYRAAEFSVRRHTLWALEVLAELGFEYDSSVFPIHHRRYGIPDFSPRPSRYDLQNGLHIFELPLATVPLRKFNIPIAGGGYFRLLPFWCICHTISHLNAAGSPAVTYFHPYEFDSQRLDVFEGIKVAGWRQWLRGSQINFLQNLGRPTMRNKLAGLLKRFTFITCKAFLGSGGINERRALLQQES